MKVLWRYLLPVAALMAASLLLGACGGEEEELSLDEYFQRLEKIIEDLSTRSEKLDERYEDVWEDVEATQHYFDGLVEIYKQRLKDVRGLHPPPEARDAHDEYVAAQAANMRLADDFKERLAGVGSPSELEDLREEVTEEEKYQASSERVDEACRELQGIADDNGIDVDLDCP